MTLGSSLPHLLLVETLPVCWGLGYSNLKFKITTNISYFGQKTIYSMDSPIYTNSANSLSSASLANLMFKLSIIKISLRALAVKSSYCYHRGSRFSSQHPHDSLHLPVTPVKRNLMSSFGFHMLLHASCAHNTLAHTTWFLKFQFKFFKIFLISLIFSCSYLENTTVHRLLQKKKFSHYRKHFKLHTGRRQVCDVLCHILTFQQGTKPCLAVGGYC